MPICFSPPTTTVWPSGIVTTLSAEGLPSLSVVAPEARVCELEFVFPVLEAPPSAAGAGAAFQPVDAVAVEGDMEGVGVVLHRLADSGGAGLSEIRRVG